MDKEKILIVYHSEDNDGAGSAGVVMAFLGMFGIGGERVGETPGAEIPEYDIMEIGVTHTELNRYWENHKKGIRGEGLKDIANWMMCDRLFMVDIAFADADAMDDMHRRFGDKFAWCDHHAPAIEASKKKGFGKCGGVRKTSQSAILNTWEYMCSLCKADERPSDEIVMLSDYDSWKWVGMDKYRDNADFLLNFNSGIAFESGLNPYWFMDWVRMYLGRDVKHHETAAECRASGRVIRKHDARRLGKAIRECSDTSWTCSGRKTCMLITTEYVNSLVFKNNLKDKRIRNGAVLKCRGASGKWELSIYNVSDKDEFHCGEYMRSKYGGGGHAGAAGCTIDEATAMKMIRTKTI